MYINVKIISNTFKKNAICDQTVKKGKPGSLGHFRKMVG